MLKKSSAIALILLFMMGVIAVMSAREDSVTMDESPHITAGYSYLKFNDYRLNPEHPPLIKDIAAIPLLFQDINFPLDHPAWTNMINAQWDLGPQFLYRSGNDPDNIIFWGRMGPILLTLLFGWFVFLWARKLYDVKWALFTLSLFVFSPTIMAHGRLVTTDVAAAFAFFISIYAYVNLLRAPNNKNLLIAGVAFAVAQLLKFSLVLLFGFLPAITILWILLNSKSEIRNPKQYLNHNDKNSKRLEFNFLNFEFVSNFVLRISNFITQLIPWSLRFLAIIAITTLIILPVYSFHVANYPIEKQVEDIEHILQQNRFPAITDAFVWMADKPLLRPYAQYLLGVSMVFMRVAGGNTTYFLGEVSNQAWPHYFPVAFALKVPLALIILSLISLLAFKTRHFVKLKNMGFLNYGKDLFSKMRLNFDEVAMLLFFLFYWIVSVTGNLNIGVRHILPTLPFLYLLITGQLARWLHARPQIVTESMLKSIKSHAGYYASMIKKITIIALLLAWYIFSFSAVYPHFIAYFNELAGGPNNGYKYIVDSNLDWGQDLRRLAQFVEDPPGGGNIDSIKVDYFGGGDVRYYLGEKAEIWHADNGPTTGWLAVSATFLQTSRGFPQASYGWLDEYEPVAKMGWSIFVYNIK